MTQFAVRDPLGAENRSLRNDVLRSLQSTGYTALAGLDCRAQQGVVELFGRVPTFYFKQLAQCVAMRLPGVRELRNEICVD